MKITGDWLLRDESQQLLGLLEQAGHQAHAVGGCVRNVLMGEPVADIDVATDARPDAVIGLAGAAGLRVIPTGIDHGTVTVILGACSYEITTWRHDVETDGRRAVIAFADRIEDDAMRRDFTMNALYAAKDGTVTDPLGTGIRDALSRRIRFVGEPQDRIREDYLRILRFFRFYAWYGDPAEGPDPEGLAACTAQAEGIAQLSRERIGAEMKKLLGAPDPAPALAMMQASGVLARVLPGADARAMALLVHFEAEIAPHWPRRLAVLGAADPASALRLSRAEARDQTAILDGVGAALSAAALGVSLGEERAQAAILARAALLEQPPPPAWQDNLRRGVASRFPVSARDLPHLTGPRLGQRLKALEQAWLASDLGLDKAALLAMPPAEASPPSEAPPPFPPPEG